MPPDFSAGFFDYPTLEVHERAGSLTFLPDRDEADWATVLEHMETLPFARGSEVIHAGDDDRSLYLLTAGTLSARAGGRNLRRIEAPSVVGEIAFLDGGRRSLTLVAETDGQLRRLSLQAFERLAARHPELARAILFDLGRIVAARLRSLTDALGGPGT